jgi:hypothetical protein
MDNHDYHQPISVEEPILSRAGYFRPIKILVS